jgi:hypothetical protein
MFTVECIVLKDTRHLGSQMRHLSLQAKHETDPSHPTHCFKKQVRLLSRLSMNKYIGFNSFSTKALQ